MPEPKGDLAEPAARLGVELTERQVDTLWRFAALLERWNSVYNLTAIRDRDQLRTHHLLDSLALAPFVARCAAQGARRVLDVGSGGGLPGLVLAIVLPTPRFTLIDAVQKKCAFMTQACVELGLRNVEVIHARVERHRGEPFEVIVSRALSTLSDLVRVTRHLLAPGGCWLAMKGRYPAADLAALEADVALRAVHPLVVPGLNEQRHVIELVPVQVPRRGRSP